MTTLNKFGITDAQMLTIAGKHDVSYTFGKGSMARILAYSQELLSLAAPAVANAATGELPPLPDAVMHTSIPYYDGRDRLYSTEQMQAYARAAVAAAAPNAVLVAALEQIASSFCECRADASDVASAALSTIGSTKEKEKHDEA